MRITKKFLSMILAIVMVLGLLPMAAFATGTNNVHISVSYDGKYIADKNGDPIAYVPVSFEELASVDLDAYNLGEYKYDEDGDGAYEITALHMVIYAHENIYGGDFSEVTVTGSPGSSYFAGGVFGFDENLNYYLNGEYPLASAGWGATSDQIVLEAGDYLDIGSFSSWDFFGDSNYGFHFFADENGTFTHNYTAEENEACAVKLVRSYSGMGSGATVFDEAGYEVSYGTALYDAAGTVTTDDSGCAEITFPAAGTWYLWVDGGYGFEYPDSVVSTPAYAEVTVTAVQEEEPQQFGFSGSTMTLGNELVLNFVFDSSKVTGTDNYAVATIAREGGDATVTIPQSKWSALNDSMTQIPVTLFAKEMTDDVTVVIYSAEGEQLSLSRTDSIADCCGRMLSSASAAQEDKILAVDMLNYGAAAQIQFKYAEETLANANLTEDQKALATVVTDMNDASKKGAGCAGSTLTLEDKILLNFVYNNSTIDNAAYATVSYVDHYNTPVSYNIEAADFKYFNDDMKMIQINTLVVADCRTLVCVELFDADGNSMGTSTDSVESYTARSGQGLFEAILAFGYSAYNKFHN